MLGFETHDFIIVFKGNIGPSLQEVLVSQFFITFGGKGMHPAEGRFIGGRPLTVDHLPVFAGLLDKLRLVGIQRGASHRDDHQKNDKRMDIQRSSHTPSVSQNLALQNIYCLTKYFKTVETAGPRVTRKNTGKMNKPIGNISFMGIFWANSSAR